MQVTRMYARFPLAIQRATKIKNCTYSSLLTDTLSFRDCEDEQLLPIVCLNKLSVTSSFLPQNFSSSRSSRICNSLSNLNLLETVLTFFFPEFPFKFSISLLLLSYRFLLVCFFLFYYFRGIPNPQKGGHKPK